MTQNRRALVLALVVVALGVVVVMLLLNRRVEGGVEPSSAPPTTAVPMGSQTTGSGIGGSPTVVANPRVGFVDFTWSYSGSQATDTYRVQVGTTAEDAQIADPITLSTAAYSVKVRSGTQACLIAMVVRSGETSPGSGAVCGTAR